MTRDVAIDFAALAHRLRASTVRVHDGAGHGSGSGVVWRADGLVVTNAHVVRGDAAVVAFESGRRERAQVVRRDDARDLAALQLPPGEAVPVTARAARELRPGELVVAVGNPLGVVGAMTAGLVQQCNPRWVVADVRLAPGNSGGPLADTAGRVVGINSLVAGGLGFAVPTEAVAAFLGAAPRRRLGVALAAALLRTPGAAGARRAYVVTAVEAGSVAARAGLALGDAIVATEAGALDETDDVAALLCASATLVVLRGGERRAVALEWAEDARAA